ncbi:MAG: hypothetical protein Q9217_000457 [Psora testacea]
MNDLYGELSQCESNTALPPSNDPTPSSQSKKQSPQRSVDRFWEKFTTQHPGTVRNVLPSDIYAQNKALKTPKGEVNGQRAVKSYDQATLECKRAVEKIAKECRRVNHKYRDQHFDIEFDLKRGPRDCLDGLERKSAASLASPGSVKRVPDIFQKPQFYIDDASASDVRQGFNGDCWFLSALCAISNKKHLIDRVCVARDEQVGVYGFVFHRDGEWFHTVIDDKLYLTASDWWESSDSGRQTFGLINRQDAEESYRKAYQTGSKALYFAQCREENETWLPLLEKAFAKAHGDYSSIEGGFTGEAIEDLTGGVTTELFTTDILDKDRFWKEEILKVNDKFLFGCSTGTFDKWQDSEVASQTGARSGIIRQHAYSIMDALEKNGQKLLKIRNPWGTDEWRGAWSDGSEQWTPEWMQLLDHRFGDDGMFWISYDDLLRKYSEFERTRLFDKDWMITQQWTTVNVPWSADYNDTKFSITITKKGPLVIVLSQLDDRYFRGMEGQYSFQLHFRLDKDGERDYIVRSHGNYSMWRSVSADLELDPGTYSVLMRITARRNTSKATPEKMIRENCKDRQNKLIQIGLSYDLAHAKCEIIETEEEKERRVRLEEKRKAADRKKMKQELSIQKRKEWERKKKLKAREKRRAKRKEEYMKKKAEKQKAAEGPVAGNNATPEAPADGVTTAASAVNEDEKQAGAGATNNQSGEPVADAASMSTPPAESEAKKTSTPTTGANGAPDGNLDGETVTTAVDPPAATSPEAAKAAQFERDLNSIPSVTVNGPPAAPASNPAPSAPPSVAGADDDWLYDSDVSFHSSIDSVLDLPEDATSTGTDNADVDDALGADDDAKFENDAWNAVCVVGLRVFSKDAGCCIKVVRPRAEEGDEEAGLEVDDVSKGISEGEREGKGGQGGVGEVKTELKHGV